MDDEEERRGASTFAEVVRAWRQRRGWTQEELSHHSGLSTRAIRSLERGRIQQPRRTTVQMLADALQVPREKFMATIRRGVGEEDTVEESTPEQAQAAGPRELPPDLEEAEIVGVASVVEALLRGRGRAPHRPAIVTRTGPEASALAIRAAHRCATAFPDGQLYANLASAIPIPAADILRRFLRSLGVPDRPGGSSRFATDELAAAFRSALAGRRTLIVLDQAAAEAQIRPLIPAEAGCAVLVVYASGGTNVVNRPPR